CFGNLVWDSLSVGKETNAHLLLESLKIGLPLVPLLLDQDAFVDVLRIANPYHRHQSSQFLGNPADQRDDALFTTCSQRIENRSTQSHQRGSKSEALQHVAPSAKSPVHYDFSLTFGNFNDFVHDLKGVGQIVQRVSAMI